MDSDDTPIIVNEDALTEAFIPTRLLHRESHIRELERGIEAGPRHQAKTSGFRASLVESSLVFWVSRLGLFWDGPK